MIGSIRVLVDGVPVKRRDRRSLAFDIPMADGSTTELSLTGLWTGMKAVANGVELPLEPPTPRYALVVMFLPLMLVIGGILGALIGVGGMGINTQIVRSRASGPVKVLAGLGVTILAIALYFTAAIGVNFAVTPVPTLQTGTCVNSIKPGVTVTGDVAKPVNCAAPHDNEIIGSTAYTAAGAFPGSDALQEFARTPCVATFEDYVGGTFDASHLDMIAVTPSELTWAKGDRQVTCVVLAGDGSQLTGSVKGTAQ
jgi:hypothetical protein